MDRVNYVIISPVKDEERYIELTLRSVIAQTVPPRRWIIVNDGSTDRTAEIVARYAAENPWIELINKENEGGRKRGGGVVRTFYRGFELMKGEPWGRRRNRRMRPTVVSTAGCLGKTLTLILSRAEMKLAW